VVQLQTNFGGGKTHSMLALYHLFSGIAPTELAGHRRSHAGGRCQQGSPTAQRVVLVGNKISPGNPSTKPDGTVVRTLWGELAWQLGGKKPSPACRPTTRRRPAPATCCASCSTTTAPA
jgi:predicted AAA+ superfamily ATPase